MVSEKHMKHRRFTALMGFVLTAWAVLAWTTSADAQNVTLRGVVTDAATGAPLSYVNVTTGDPHVGAVTDANGYFSLSGVPATDATVTFSLIGYESSTVENISPGVSEAGLLRVALTPTVLQGQTVVVTATRTPRVLRETPVSASVITRYDIERRQLQTPADAIGAIPGVNISGGAPGAVTSRSTVIMQGMPAQYSLVLVDGQRLLSEHIHTGVNLNLVPMDFVERIEVVKGPASALYGSDAFAGVVNIITRTPGDYPIYGLRTYYGSDNTIHAGGYFGASVSGVSAMLAYNKERTDGEKDGDEYDRDNVELKLGYRPTSVTSIDGRFSFYDGDYATSDDRMWSGQFGGSLQVGNESTVRIRATLQNYHRNYIKSGNDATADNEIYTFGGQFETLLLSVHSVTAGAEARFNRFSRLATAENDEIIYSAFVQDEMDYAPFKAAAAVSIDRHEHTGTYISPKLSVLYALPTNTDLRAAIGRGFRAPSLQDLYEYHYDHGTWWRDGNVDLDPETSTSYSVGVEQRFGVLFMGAVTAFRTDVKDLIATVNTGEVASDGDPVLQRENIREARSQGVETEFMVRPVNGVDLRATYTYLDTRDETNDRPLEYNPKHSISFEAVYAKTDWGLRASVAAHHVRDRSFWDKNASIHTSMDDYTLVNCSVSQRIYRQLVLFGTVQNIFDEEFETYEEGKRRASFGRKFSIGLSFTGGL